MKKETVTRKEVAKCVDCKKIFTNIIAYFLTYVVLFAGAFAFLLLINPTWGLILVIIFTLIAGYLIIYQAIRYVHIVNGADKMPCYAVKLDKVNYYLLGKIPVFAAAIPTETGVEVIETNAVYHNKDIDTYLNHRAKVLYDAKKKRIYVITLLN